MSSDYKFIDHTADIAIEVSGNTYEELFTAALNGWKESVIESADDERETEEMNIKMKENSPEELLVSFLQEVNYLFDSKKIIPLENESIRIEKREEEFQLTINIHFGKITADDIIKTEIKAVTFHQLDIKKINDVYKTIIVFDI
jgi:SHS2 domain-containing protein